MKKQKKFNTELPSLLESHASPLPEVSCPYMDVFGHCSHKFNNISNKYRKLKPVCKYKNNVDKCPLYKQWVIRNKKFK